MPRQLRIRERGMRLQIVDRGELEPGKDALVPTAELAHLIRTGQ
jgi:hypothetical protein